VQFLGVHGSIRQTKEAVAPVGIHLIFRTLTEIRALEEVRWVSEAMAALGEMAAGDGP